MDCTFPSNSDVEDVISRILPTADSPSTPTVDVSTFQPLCLAYSQERNRYRFFSVLVRYTCEGNANCPSGTALEQIESQCINGEWSNSVLGSVENTRRTDPTATLSTTTREDCAFCLSTDLANPMSLNTDSLTHCVGEYYIYKQAVLNYFNFTICKDAVIDNALSCVLCISPALHMGMTCKCMCSWFTRLSPHNAH